MYDGVIQVFVCFLKIGNEGSNLEALLTVKALDRLLSQCGHKNYTSIYLVWWDRFVFLLKSFSYISSI